MIKIIGRFFRVTSFVALSFLSVCYYCNQNQVFAQYITGPQTLAIGNAGRASQLAVESVYYNPATLVHAPRADLMFYYNNADLSNDKHLNQYGLSILDNSEDTLFSGHVGYFRSRTFEAGQSPINEVFYQLSGAFRLKNGWSVGISGKRWDHKIEMGSEYRQYNGDIGIMFAPQDNLAFGVVYSNPVNAAQEIPLSLRQLPQLGFGSSYIWSEMIELRADVSKTLQENPQNKLKWNVGMAHFFSDFITLAFGWEHDERLHRSFYTGGVAINTPRFSLSYGMKSSTSGEKNAMHSVDLRLPIW